MQQLKLSNCKVNSLNFSRTKIVPPSPSLIHRGNSKLLNPLHVKLLPSSLCLKLKQLPVINKNLLLLQDLDSTDLVQSALYDIIQKGGAGKITKGAKKLKLEKGILLDNYVQRGPRLVDAQSRSLLIHSKRSKRHMSLKQHKKCGSFHLHDTFHRFDLYKPMHEMWKEYMRELTKSTPKKQLAESLLSSDLHGALLIVAQCKAALYEGVSGIMICDTAETFGIISEDNHFRVVPKAGSVFVLQADCWKVTLMGDKLSPKETLKENQRQQRAQSLIR
ncbi:ribonuclease P protein subunit p29 isoform X2 [Brachypodium distachyon]|uniref:ribonuclease P protein subunit p29 isoform X2 n=1 Tax=Brachypodium distachyon TaxID=15368 RepID=UPI00052FFF53|nr:ribonuclease P protein subunit p29 isoform X2 [Brachypodium distachyon]|eukprot:XP_010238831.1 ribonuclease P protein subunit p29 isoform X2 [Brachypodium distachyon]